MHLLKHLYTIHHHHKLVCRYCFRLGLYRQGLLHDLSKYSPTEFIPGIKYYYGYKSPNYGERETIGYSSAWMHHKGRNKHHYEYWTDYQDGHEGLCGIEMPMRYVAEMVCDRIAASKTYNGNNYNDSLPYQYFLHSDAPQLMHPNTARLLKKLLQMLTQDGEEKTFAYMRKLLRTSR